MNLFQKRSKTSPKPGDPASPDRPVRRGRPGQEGQGGRGGDGRDSEWQERVIRIRRVTKVVKGGKNMSFSALVVVGDMKGNLGIGHGKAAEVVDAIKKGIENAKKNIIRLRFDQGSIPHNTEGQQGSCRILMFKAPKGTGLICSWCLKMALEVAGLRNVVCKVIGSTNPGNVMGALTDAVNTLKTKTELRVLRAPHNAPSPTPSIAPPAV